MLKCAKRKVNCRLPVASGLDGERYALFAAPIKTTVLRRKYGPVGLRARTYAEDSVMQRGRSKRPGGLGMSDETVTAWVDTWSSRYSGYDNRLFIDLGGRPELNAEQLARIVEWKSKRLWSARKLRDVRAFEDARPGRITEITRLAFSASDPELALHILTLLPGVQSRTASAVLTVHDAARYTIMDTNALVALRGEPVLGVQRELEDAMANLPSGDAWWRALFPTWLRACRKLADRSGRPLRNVDQALMAWGQAAG